LHAKRPCPFIKKGKKSPDLTVGDFLELEAERFCRIMSVSFKEYESRFLSSAKEVEKKIMNLGAKK
jgi:hypothetical protein